MMVGSFWQDKGADYALYRPTYPASLVKELANLAVHKRLVIDVGCGTGQFSSLLADHFDMVIACDVGEDQLANAPDRSNIQYKLGSAEAIAAESGSAGMIVAAQAAHWFDLPAFYEEVRRVASDDALVALVTYGVLEVEGVAKDRLMQFYWEDIHAYWPEGRENVENGYRDFNFPFKLVMTPSFSIERQWDIEQFFNYTETWSAVKRMRLAGKDVILEKARQDLLGLIGPDTKIDIKWPISIRAGRVQRQV